jgi:prephenate dehydrogenase
LSGEFRRVAIVGCGLIGGSIELALRERTAADVVTLDRSDSLDRLADADLVILAAPILQIIDLLPRLAAHVGAGTLVTDTGSTKAAIVEAAGGMRFIGGHPIAGAAAGGRTAARADLFAGRPWVLTPRPTTPDDDLRRLRRFVETLGGEPHCLDAAEHDRVFSFVSHLPQLAISALMEVAGSRAGAQGLALAGDGLRGSTRLAASPADIWIDILATNRANITGAIDALIAALGALRDDESGRTLRQTFERAAELKQVLDRRRS